ncbi:hypothetical protein WJX74_004051 [Apatococcus lobatus]|uniref:PsbP C-terminal domain-containing protein n=1 Tax=Apatococcus lobatus TaxID=904363 RepID=A0AAW1SDL1_9CHLO
MLSSQQVRLCVAVPLQSKQIQQRPNRVSCSANTVKQQLPSRRQLLEAAVLTAGISLLPPNLAQAADEGGLKQFKPNKQSTPSLRSGQISAENVYSFSIPTNWSQEQVANIKSGNFCMPRCDEPWTEFIFQNSGEGKLELTVAPLRRITQNPKASIDQVGSLDGIIESFGNFITGTYLEPDDVVSRDKKSVDGRTYYVFEANAPYGSNGAHTLTSVTTKDGNAYLFVVSANEKQWSKSQSKLRKLQESFRA